jgi:hypothetical protein
VTALSTLLVEFLTSRDICCRNSRMTRSPTVALNPLPDFRRDLLLVMGIAYAESRTHRRSYFLPAPARSSSFENPAHLIR